MSQFTSQALVYQPQILVAQEQLDNHYHSQLCKAHLKYIDPEECLTRDFYFSFLSVVSED